MIDFVKLIISDNVLIETVWNNPCLEYHSETGRRVSVDEVKQIDKRSYKNMLFTRYGERLEITGSIHYLFNNGVHNANRFTVADCIMIIRTFIEQFQLTPQLCTVVNLEFGINVISPFDVKKVVTSLRYHSKNEFRTLPTYQYSKQSNRFDTRGNANTHKIIKAYAKGLQEFEGYKPEPNTFRFEVKSKRAKYIKTLGIRTINDLLNPDVYLICKDHLMHEWGQVLLIDNVTDYSSCRAIQKYLSVDYWENAVQGHRNTFTNAKRKYYDSMCNFPDNMYSTLSRIVESELFLILKKRDDSASHNNCEIETRPPYETNINVRFPLYINGEYAHSENPKRCKLTGLDISMQKDESDLLSHTGLKYYYEHRRNVFEYLKRKFLTDTWRMSDYEKQIKEIAHNIRNYSGNINRKQKRIYHEKQYSLFKL